MNHLWFPSIQVSLFLAPSFVVFIQKGQLNKIVQMKQHEKTKCVLCDERTKVVGFTHLMNKLAHMGAKESHKNPFSL